MSGFIKLMRSGALELIENKPNAFLLLSVIAIRAKWDQESNSIHRLETNQAYIGDPKRIGLTSAEYKTAKKNLSEAGLVDFKTIPGKGTIATLLNTAVFDINASHEVTSESPPRSSMKNHSLRPINNHDQTSAQPLNHQPVTTQQPLTKKKEREKETTTPCGNGRVFKCLEEESRLSEQEREDLMRLDFPEERIKLGIEYSHFDPPTTTLFHLVRWHCSQPIPPTPKITCRLKKRAWEFNNLLKENGYSDLAEENIQIISQDRMRIPTLTGSTTITLKTSLEQLEQDLTECSTIMHNKEYKNQT